MNKYIFSDEKMCVVLNEVCLFTIYFINKCNVDDGQLVM